MYNQKLIKTLKLVAVGLFALLFLALGFGGGSIYEKTQTKKVAANVQKERTPTSSEEAVSDVLSEKTVRDFLLIFYTKTDLGENRHRYKPLMTTSLYEATIKEEESAAYQAYKGYLVDQMFDTATIYIDKENKAALAQVTYTNVLLSEKNNREGLSTKQTVNVSVRLNFVVENGQFLVSHLTPVAITDSTDKTSTRFNPSIPSSSTPSSSSSETETDEPSTTETETEVSDDE